MSSAMFLDNLRSWVVQVFVIASIGAVLPLVFRIRHPRSQLAYCHLLLVVCLVLPAVQPWRHPVVAMSSAQQTAASTVAPALGAPAQESQFFHANQIVFWVIIAGFAARICWTAGGLWLILRHRLAAAPLYPIPESVKEASILTQTEAQFCLSASGIGPVTFGFLRPVVLLPESFLELDAAAQCGIACHELLHVRRRDWLVTLAEEITGAAVWFHPAFWWLLAQARLAREQVVDAEVVRITSAREPYINALLAMAGARPALDLAPAPLFLRRRHLLQRMHLLVTEVSMSRIRLFVSYAGIAAILALAGWLGLAAFPLIGRAEIREAAAPPQQNSPGYVVNIQATAATEGAVVVELTFNAAGNIVDSRVLSGPEELRKTALESALRRNYSINVARTLQVVVEFHRPSAQTNFVPPPPPPPPPPSPPPPGFQSFNGTLESIEVTGLPEPGLANLQQRLQAFQGQAYSADLWTRIKQVVGTTNGVGGISPISMFRRKGTADDRVVLQLNFGLVPAIVQTPFGPFAVPANGVQTPFGTLTGAAGGVLPNLPTIEPISKVPPNYPPPALQARIQGVVVMEVVINSEGKVQNIKVRSGHPLLIQAAIESVKQWIYPAQAGDTTTLATINFSM